MKKIRGATLLLAFLSVILRCMGPQVQSAFIEAAGRGNIPEMERLRAQGASVDGRIYFSALHLAAQNGQIHVMRYLLDHGANPNAWDHYGNPPIEMAIGQNRLEAVRLLVSRGARVNSTNSRGQSALWYAARSSRNDAFHLLIQLGADIRQRDVDGNGIITAAAMGCSDDIVKYLVQHGISVDDPNNFQESPLMHATDLNCSKTMALLLQLGADVNRKSVRGVTALKLAQKDRRREQIIDLLNAGAIDEIPANTYSIPQNFPLCKSPVEIKARLMDSEITFADKAISLPAPLARVFAVLGPSDRVRQTRKDGRPADNYIHTWDRLGIYAYEKQGSGKIKEIAFLFHRGRSDFEPACPFTGAFHVGDANVRYGGSAIEFARKAKEAGLPLKDDTNGWIVKTKERFVLIGTDGHLRIESISVAGPSDR